MLQLAVSVTVAPTCALLVLALSEQTGGGMLCQVTVTEAGALVPALLVAATENVRAPGVAKLVVHVLVVDVQLTHA